MKKITTAFCLILFLYISLRGCDDRTEDEKLIQKVMNNVIKILESRYQLNYIGQVVAADKKYYNGVGLEFKIFRILSRDEGRKILIDCIEELLKEINANPKLQPYLQPYPFTLANIEITIYVYYPDGKFAYPPEIGVFSFVEGIFKYGKKIQKPDYPYGFFSNEEESYEEALKIVKSQIQLP